MEFVRLFWRPLYHRILLLFLSGARNVDIIRELNVSRSTLQRAINDMIEMAELVDPNADSKQVALLNHFHEPQDRRPGDDLEITWYKIWSERTPHQRQVWRLVMKNLKIGMIAEQVGISEVAVQDILQKIFEVVGVNSRLELVLWSLDHEPPQASSAVNSAAQISAQTLPNLMV
jgi:DNA-binding CsgD family transcriptional regulator